MMGWTGASERTVKYWLSGERGPNGEHLILLAQHSDAALVTILTMAERLSTSGTDVQAVLRACSCCKTLDKDSHRQRNPDTGDDRS
ncbi:MAG: hypothetical protein Q8O82_13700 [Pseudorhodobacter sp.]|nr:hypothetical protein [Pseudorhodobacter sp.]